MKRMDSGTVGKQLAAILRDGEPVEITRYGKPIGVVKPYPVQMDRVEAGHPSIRPEAAAPVVKNSILTPTTTSSVTPNATVTVAYDNKARDELLNRIRK